MKKITPEEQYQRDLETAINRSLQSQEKRLDDKKSVAAIERTNCLVDLKVNNEYADLLKIGIRTLNDYQKVIFDECRLKDSGGLSLPLGSGKTLLSLVLSLYMTVDYQKPILVVVSKSLLGSWETEIKKFFGDQLRYTIVHQNLMKDGLASWKLKESTHLVLTTADVIAKSYSENGVNQRFVYQEYDDARMTYITCYKTPFNPLLKHSIGSGVLFSVDWGCLIVDEIQKYTNVSTKWCQGLGALKSDHRWGLSGTMFDEPKIQRILGYHLIINAPDKPRNLPDTQKLVHSINFKGLNELLVHRKENAAFDPPNVRETIVKHRLSDEEEKIYTTMRTILLEIKKNAELAKLHKDEDELKKLNSYKLVMVMYLRQALICPIIPITSVALKASDMREKSELSKIIMNEMDKLGLTDWLNKEESIESSRLTQVIEACNQHKNEKVVIFSCFKSFLDIGEYLFKKKLTERPLFRMTSSMSSTKRTKLIKDFEKTTNGILLLTYQLGAEGLNLQFATTVMLVDFWWNASKEQQAIGRIYRYGQKAEEINVYFFTANTGIEEILFKKQKAKNAVLEELKTGKIKTKVPRLKLDEVIKLIALSANEDLIKKIDYY